jgi:hypothetical protein
MRYVMLQFSWVMDVTNSDSLSCIATAEDLVTAPPVYCCREETWWWWRQLQGARGFTDAAVMLLMGGIYVKPPALPSPGSRT